MIKKQLFPILEYDDTYVGIIHAPHHLKKLDIPKRCVLTFFQDVITTLLEEGKLTHVIDLKSEAGKHPLYTVEYEGQTLCLMHPMLGGPYAVAVIEELIALGCTTFIACGGCGVLDANLPMGHLIIPNEALRCEGASYHYLPPSRTVLINEVAKNAIMKTCDEEKIPYHVGKTWTTDAFYRETKDMIAYRKEEGCIAVEMECASFASVSEFRKVTFGQLLYAGDNVGSEVWDGRFWKSRQDIRRGVVEISMKACLKL